MKTSPTWTPENTFVSKMKNSALTLSLFATLLFSVACSSNSENKESEVTFKSLREDSKKSSEEFHELLDQLEEINKRRNEDFDNWNLHYWTLPSRSLWWVESLEDSLRRAWVTDNHSVNEVPQEGYIETKPENATDESLKTDK